ncbi:hypothetical protein [uncultured Duncaniella sp.]|uniref:hypothetical protein n=1 Tax=uncultured Duncaniella sp. TaxID=2768039 RepID=UPI0025DE850E|nr:hypothetical protein [uncultured Duncaniella sp.]
MANFRAKICIFIAIIMTVMTTEAAEVITLFSDLSLKDGTKMNNYELAFMKHDSKILFVLFENENVKNAQVVKNLTWSDDGENMILVMGELDTHPTQQIVVGYLKGDKGAIIYIYDTIINSEQILKSIYNMKKYCYELKRK